MRYIFLLLIITAVLPVHGGALIVDKILAVINGQPVTWSEVYRELEFIAPQDVRNKTPEERRRFFEDNIDEILEEYINKKVILQEAISRGIGVAPDEIDEAIERIKKKYSMSDDLFLETIKREGFTLPSYKKLLSEQILVSKMISQDVRGKVVILDKEIDDYIKLHPELTGPEKYHLRQIFLKRPSESEIQAFQKRLDTIVDRLKSGESFEKVATLFSDDRRTTGGDLGYIKKDDLSRAFLDAIQGLKPGEISKPFFTEKGLFILKVEDKIGGMSYEEARNYVREILWNQRFNELYRRWLRNLRERYHIEIKS